MQARKKKKIHVNDKLRKSSRGRCYSTAAPLCKSKTKLQPHCINLCIPPGAPWGAQGGPNYIRHQWPRVPRGPQGIPHGAQGGPGGTRGALVYIIGGPRVMALYIFGTPGAPIYTPGALGPPGPFFLGWMRGTWHPHHVPQKGETQSPASTCQSAGAQRNSRTKS